jgi:putative copper export protein
VKFLEFISTFLSQSLSFLSPTAIIDQLVERMQRILKALIILFICSIMSCVTTAYLIDRFLNQLDAGEFVLSKSIVLLFVLLFGLGITIFFTLKNITSKAEEAKKIQEMKSTESALEAALAALVMSYVSEREEKRKINPENTSAAL